MYHLVKRAVAPHPALSILRRNYWTQGKGRNYSTNMIVVGISTIICGLVGIGYQKWKLDKEYEI